MIIDTLSNAEKYFCIHSLFAKAYEYIRSVNLNSIEDGTYEIIGNELKAIISKKAGKTIEESIGKLECHNKYIDIQLCINGKEQMGWKPRESCNQRKDEYSETEDVTFYLDTPDTYFELIENQFVIFFPEDVHAPMIGDGDIKKMVIKVKI